MRSKNGGDIRDLQLPKVGKVHKIAQNSAQKTMFTRDQLQKKKTLTNTKSLQVVGSN